MIIDKIKYMKTKDIIEQPPIDVASNNPGSLANASTKCLTTTTTTIRPSEETPYGVQYLFDFGVSNIPSTTTTASNNAVVLPIATTVSVTENSGNKKISSNHEIAESTIGSVIWTSETEGYCTCPGINSHTTKDGNHDCMVYIDHVPTVYCLHSSCKSAVDAKNKELRKAFNESQMSEGSCKKKKLTPEQIRLIKERNEKNSIRLRAKNARCQILEDKWLYADICKDSPVAVQGNEENHWKLLLQMFPKGDVIWIGGLYDSGKSENTNSFKTKEDWLTYPIAPSPFICPATFKPRSYKRSNESIVARRFLVVESDELNRDQVGAIFKWLKNRVGLRLYAIVDTAGKSLHGWFEFPDAEELEHLKLVLPTFGCDPKLFTPSQPVRLPGALRDGKYQRLVYLSKEVAQ